jgi:dihydrofolate reductase
MRGLIVFNMMTLDGYIADAQGDMTWAHRQDAEWNEFVAGNAQNDSVFLFGRITYEMMASFWPTPPARKNMPQVAATMNRSSKFVFSRTLQETSWENSTVLKGDLIVETRKLKKSAGPDILVFGSGSIVAQLAQAGLVDEFQMVINPLVLGHGKSMFSGIISRLTLQLVRTRIFGNGNVLLCYRPAR